MSTAVAIGCGGCARAERLALAGHERVPRCRDCGAEFVRVAVVARAARVVRVPAPCAKSDLEWFASKGWYVRFHGRALPSEPVVPSGGPSTREAKEDERTRDFHRAAAIHRRLEAMRTGDGCLWYQVLIVCYVENGPDARNRWSDFMGRIGWLFATPKQRFTWETKRRSIKSAAPRKFGESLHDQAVKAYESRAE
jgi:hypothetical protein